MIKRNQDFRIQTVSAVDDIGNFQLAHIFNEDDRPKNMNILAVLTIEPGEICGLHKHEGESDTYYVVSGSGLYTDSDGHQEMLYAGDAAWAYDGESHGIENKGDIPLVMLAVIPFA